MDFIPTFRFIVALALFGLMMYIYIPLIEYLSSMFPTSGVYSIAIFFMWALLPAINLFGSGIRLLMKSQERRHRYV